MTNERVKKKSGTKRKIAAAVLRWACFILYVGMVIFLIGVTSSLKRQPAAAGERSVYHES